MTLAIITPSILSRLVAAVLLAVLALGAQSASGHLRLCNESPVPLYTAVGYGEGDNWYASGWWRIWPSECRVVYRNKLSRRHYYFRAEATAGQWVWGDGPTFCVDNEAFTRLRDGDCEARGYEAREFHEIDTGESGRVTHRLTCTGCSLPRVRYDRRSKEIDVYHVHRQNLDGARIFTELTGSFRVSLLDNRLRIGAEVRADLDHLQDNIESILRSKAQRNEECGDRVQLRSASLTPSGRNAILDVNFHYERWLCTYADLPQTRCEDTWIRVGPLKTKGIPKCTVWVDTVRTSKNRVFGDSGRLTVRLEPRTQGRHGVGVQAVVTRARFDGMGQHIADLFRIDLRGLAQREISQALASRNIGYAIPDELRRIVRLRNVRFAKLGNGSLGVIASGSVTVGLGDVPALCRKLAVC